MTSSETKGILAVLRAAYPNFYARMERTELMAIVNLWQRQFAEDDANAVMAAVEGLIATRTSTMPPVIGEVKEKLAELTQPKGLTESEAWALVAKAVRNGIYGYKTEFEKLPPEVQAAVGRPEQLRDWAMCETDQLQTVIASNFMRSYKIHAKRKHEFALLPEGVKHLVGQIAGSMSFENNRLLEGKESAAHLQNPG